MMRWQNALDQLRDMVFSIEVINPVTLCARNVTFGNANHVEGKMRTAPIQTWQFSVMMHNGQINRQCQIQIQTGTNLLMKKINDFNAGTSNTETLFQAMCQHFSKCLIRAWNKSKSACTRTRDVNKSRRCRVFYITKSSPR